MGDSRHRSVILVLCCMAQFIVILDVSIVTVALPSMSADLDFTAANLHWVVNGYTLTFAGFLMLGGRAGDLIGRREVFVFGLTIFAIASLVGGAAQSKEMLIGARGLQGLGGAAIAPTSLAILMTTFSEGPERNRALGLWGALGGAGGMVGVLLGGLLTETLSWRWVLLINVPICVAMAAAAIPYIRHVVVRAADRRADIAGALLITAGLIVLTYGIVGTESHGWGSGRTLLTLATGLGLVGVFVVVEGWIASDPLVPLRIFRLRTVSGAWIVVFCHGAAGFAFWYLLALISQNVLGYTPLESGLMFFPMTIWLVVVAQVAGRFCGRFGAGPVLAAGLSMIGAGVLWLSAITAGDSYLSGLLGPTTVIAIGFGFANVAVAVAATTGVPGADAGLASGLTNAGRQIGGSLGIALLSTIAASHTAALASTEGAVDALNAGYTRALVVAAAFAFTGALIAAIVLRHGQNQRAATEAAAA